MFLYKKIPLNWILLFLFFSAGFALIFAYISQYIFDYQPCILCLYQRKPFFVALALSLMSIAFFKDKKSQIAVIYLCLFVLAINSLIASYHVAVEQKLFKGPSTCSASSNLNEIEDLQELEVALLSAKSVKCSEPQFFLLGLSMAAWNIIYCLFLISAVLFLLSLRRRF